MSQNNLDVSGMLNCQDLLDVNNITVNGKVKVNGNIKANVLSVNGMIKVENDVEVSSVNNNGMMKIGNILKSQSVVSNGYLKAKHIDTEVCKIDGKIQLSEGINCEEFNLIIESNSYIKEIEAAKIEVKHKKIIKRYLTVNSISADEINIENVKCDYITGDKVVIGPNCNINKVEYKTSIEIHSSSKVNQQEKI